jgi:hypothetical protein
MIEDSAEIETLTEISTQDTLYNGEINHLFLFFISTEINHFYRNVSLHFNHRISPAYNR